MSAIDFDSAPPAEYANVIVEGDGTADNIYSLSVTLYEDQAFYLWQ